MNKLLALAAVALVAACAPDIPQVEPPPKAIVVQFDPGAEIPVVPVPNDLAKDPATGKIVVPPKPTDSPAQKEFNEQYLGTLDGFPFETTAKVLVTGDLAPESVNAQTVLAVDVTDGAPKDVAVKPVYAAQAITIPPPSGGWLRAHRYAIALIGGPNGLRGAAGEDVIGSETWALVSSPNPLVTCEDLAAPDCAPTVDVIPSTETDPGKRLADQTAKAKQLEQIRRGYAPLLDAIAARGVDRANIPILFTFSIVDAGEMTFDPAGSVVPFPNDILRVDGHVNLPHPTTGAPLTPQDCAGATDLQIQLTCGLNTLDGFSTLTAPISESSGALGAAAQAKLDAASVSATSVGLVPIASTAPAAEQTTPKIAPCLNCLSSPDASGAPQTTPQQLQWKLDAPLDEKTTYLGYVTGAVKDDKGKNVVASPAFALLRSSQPLVADGKSTVDILPDEQAAALEPLRAAMKPALDKLAASGVARKDLTLAFAFTTQSEASVLDQLRAYPEAVPGLPATPLFVVDATGQYVAIADAAGVPHDKIGKFLVGAFVTPVAVTGPGGTLDVKNPKPEPVQFVMAIPAAAAPAGGYPVTIFGHGLNGWRNEVLPLANALADQGQIVIASDVLFHGDRTSCTGSKAVTGQPTDDAACANPATQKCDEDPIAGRCVARAEADRDPCTPDAAGQAACAAAGQGRCVVADSKCEGGDFARLPSGKPAISGWNIFSLTNFFATRDNFRQQVVDLAQLMRVIKSPDATGLAGQAATAAGAPLTFDLGKIGYVGQSLGGILGTLYNAVSPDTTNVVLNVPGGRLPSIILTAPAFEPQKKVLLDVLGSQGIAPGTPVFDQFIGTVQWILDPADPANMAYRLTHPVELAPGVSAPNANRKAFIQFIEGDQTVPNVANFALVTAANRTFTQTPPSFGCKAPLFCYEFTEAIEGFDATTATPATRHGFLRVPPEGGGGLALTVKAQQQVATFLATGALQ